VQPPARGAAEQARKVEAPLEWEVSPWAAAAQGAVAEQGSVAGRLVVVALVAPEPAVAPLASVSSTCAALGSAVPAWLARP